jgi:hypothetical protein
MIILTLLTALCSLSSLHAADASRGSSPVNYQQPARYPGKLPLTPALRPDAQKEALITNLFFEHRSIREALETVEAELTQAARNQKQTEYPIESFIQQYPHKSEKQTAALVLVGSLIEHNLERSGIVIQNQSNEPLDYAAKLSRLAKIQSQQPQGAEDVLVPNQQRPTLSAFKKYATYAACALLFSAPFSSQAKRLLTGGILLSLLAYYKAPAADKAILHTRVRQLCVLLQTKAFSLFRS